MARPFPKRANGAGDVLYELRESHPDDLPAFEVIAVSHACPERRNRALILFLHVSLRPNFSIALDETGAQTSDCKTK